MLEVWRVEPGSLIQHADPGRTLGWFYRDSLEVFRDSPDIDTMREHGLDLSSYEDVRAQAGAIYARLKDGSLPCDGPWPVEQIELFNQWMNDRMAP